MDYDFRSIESKWQAKWAAEKRYKVVEDKSRPKFYVLDMFPYPSGAGLHVGHPLGYIASDIFARYKRLKGFNVLHPMGYDAFGLPAEQYAIQTGQHPEKTTNDNVARYRQQLDRIGFSYDWDREVRTCDPEFYKWTQWAFLKMFDSWYDPQQNKARPISELVDRFATTGWEDVSPEQWKAASEKEKSDILMRYRIAYQGETSVNWCEGLGTVLANDEVKDGLSVRGGFPVEQKKMTQWQLRVSAYAARLLDSLDRLDWSDSLKEMQRNWIGRSEGTEMIFDTVCGDRHMPVTIFTTRADTVFGVTFMVLAPESELVQQLTTPERKEEVEAYVAAVRKKTERERISETKSVTGVFSGSYGINPLTGEQVPIWISEYVLAGYGTGAIMAVPAHDSRDYAFAKKFNLPIIPLIEGCDVSEQSFDAKDGIMCNSGFLNGMKVKDAIEAAKDYVEAHGLGRRKTNYRLRDAIFSRQRYWGEPFPIYYKDGIPVPLPESELPLRLPEISSYKPSKDGEPPLARAKDWTYKGYPLEKSTMPGFAGSSAYYLRYMDPHNDKALVSSEANGYWRSVDLYVGDTEHATGHLIYSRFWNKFLFDLGVSKKEEPFKKLVNQGMIQGRSNFVYRIKDTNTFVTIEEKDKHDVTPIHVDINIVSNDFLDIDAFKASSPEYATADFILNGDGRYKCGWAVEKMSKSMYNVVNPDMIVEKYGADTLRLYEMFLGPVEQSKPWDTNGIDGCHRFLKKFWALFYDRDGNYLPDDSKATAAEEKALHKLIKKVTQDIEQFSYNTSIAAFMIAVGELSKCRDKAVLAQLVTLIAPFAPHIAEELWHRLGNSGTVCDATWPAWDEEKMRDTEVTMPVQFCGKTRFTIQLPAGISKDEAEKAALADERTARYTEGKKVVKVIVVPGRIINIVVK